MYNGADTMEGGLGPDTFMGGAGDDIIKGGKAGFDEMGVPGQDIAIYSKLKAHIPLSFTIKNMKRKIVTKQMGI